MSEEWWLAILDGSLGAVIGTVASVVVAVSIIQRQLRHERELVQGQLQQERELVQGQLQQERELVQRQLLQDRELADEGRRDTACLALLNVTYEILRTANALFARVGPDMYEDLVALRHRVAYGFAFAHMVAGDVEIAYLNMSDRVGDLEDLLGDMLAGDEALADGVQALTEHVQKLMAAVRNRLGGYIDESDMPPLP